MPVKWTPENDQLLLLKILETHEISVDAKKISAAWPTEKETPSARAITERLVKIRKDSKAAGAAHFTVSSSQNKKSASTPSTPRKPRAPKASSTNTNTNGTPISASKRKRSTTSNIKSEDDSNEDNDVSGGVIINGNDGTKAINTTNGIINETNGTDNGESALELESPTKKLRVSSQVQPEKYTETHTSDEDEEDSEISEYNDAA